MARVGERAGALRRSERGYTLIELLVAATMGMVVLGGAVTVFIGAIHSEPRASSKVTAIQQGRVAVERITRELRQGMEAPEATSSKLAILTYVKQSTCSGVAASSSIPCLVTYECASSACSRTVADPDGSPSGVPTQVVSGLSSINVFSYSPSETDPDYIGIELAFATQEGGPVVIADGATLRNVGS